VSASRAYSEIWTGSYVLVGQEKAMEETFGSACHGAGRVNESDAGKPK